MFERRLWSNFIFIWVGVLTCVVIWQITVLSFSSPDMFQINAYTYMDNNSRFSYPIHELPTTDYNQLINLTFSFSVLNLVCNDSNPLLLVLVHSSPKNFAKRKTIRETWGKNEENIKMVFVLGTVNSSDLQKTLSEENRLYNDIIQGSFLDTYRNITYKHVMVFKYVIYHCPQAKYILKTDDDVFVNMPMMKNFLTVDLSPYGASRVLFCTPRRHTKVLRTYRSKWRVTFSEYPGRNYPTYCPGWSLLYSPDVVFDLYKEAQKADYFWIDDIHITGTLTQKIHLTHTDIEPLVISSRDLKHIVNGNFYNVICPFLYGSANLKEKEIRALWKFVTTHLSAPRSVIKEFNIYMKLRR